MLSIRITVFTNRDYPVKETKKQHNYSAPPCETHLRLSFGGQSLLDLHDLHDLQDLQDLHDPPSPVACNK